MKEDPEVVILLILFAALAGSLWFIRPDRDLIDRAVQAAQERQPDGAKNGEQQPSPSQVTYLFESIADELWKNGSTSHRDNIALTSRGMFGAAARFDGKGSIVTPDVPIEREGTWMLWIKPAAASLGKAQVRVLDANGYGLAIQEGRLQGYFHDGRLRKLNADTPLRAEDWTHVALTWSGNQVRLYVNAQLADEEPYGGAPRWWTRTLVLGARWTGSGYGFKGEIDEFCALTRSLDDAAIAAAMEDGVVASGLAPAPQSP